MTFDWDKKKAVLNLKKHHISFEEATTAFFDEQAMVYPDPEHSNLENRFLLFGYSLKSRLLMVVHCETNEEKIRIISARKATKNESKIHKRRTK